MSSETDQHDSAHALRGVQLMCKTIRLVGRDRIQAIRTELSLANMARTTEALISGKDISDDHLISLAAQVGLAVSVTAFDKQEADPQANG